MRVFVTGATGFVMGAVARALRARGDAVTALVRDPSRAASLAALGCELVGGDVVHPTAAIPDLHRADALVHGAAIYEIGVTAERRRAMEETNVTGTRRVLDAARAAGTARIVYVSTIAAFGNTHGVVVAEGYRPTSPPTSAYEDTARRCVPRGRRGDRPRLAAAHPAFRDGARRRSAHTAHARGRVVGRWRHLLGDRCESTRGARDHATRSRHGDARHVRCPGRERSM